MRGVALTGKIRSTLEALGRFDILERPDGFAAIRAPSRGHSGGPIELNRIAGLVRQYEAELVKAWHECFEPGK